MVGYDPEVSKVKLEMPDGKTVDVAEKLLVAADQSYIEENWQRLGPAKLVGTYWWNCPSQNERDFFIARTVVERGGNGGNLVEVHDFHTGHSSRADGEFVFRFFKRQNVFVPQETETAGESPLRPFTIDGDRLIRNGNTVAVHFRTPGEARVWTDRQIVADEKAKKAREERAENARLSEAPLMIIGDDLLDIKIRGGVINLTVRDTSFLRRHQSVIESRYEELINYAFDVRMHFRRTSR